MALPSRSRQSRAMLEPDVAVVLFTRDLRVHDNPALAAAVRGHDAVVPLFVLDDDILSGRFASPTRVRFLLESLADLRTALASRGAPLVVRRGAWVSEVLAAAAGAGARTIHVADDHSPFATRRLARLHDAAERAGVTVRRHPGVAVVEPGAIRPHAGTHFQVFTPYHNRWLAHRWRDPAPAPRSITGIATVEAGAMPAARTLVSGSAAPDAIAGGEVASRKRMQRWMRSRAEAYPTSHDDLGADATSRLSAALHFGCLSPLEVARTALAHGADAFVRQLCWRDFHLQVVAGEPRAAWHDLHASRVRWRSDTAQLDAWREGRTGYPVVDAAMRQLRAEGFVHNRARMVAASFLTRDLRIDWRVGARHYLDHLVDGDIANNNMNWQWVAGTGCDTNPFRTFNPTLQGRRFDPDGAYVRRWVEELRDLDGDIHEPSTEQRAMLGYPEPIVDHRAAVRAFRAGAG